MQKILAIFVFALLVATIPQQSARADSGVRNYQLFLVSGPLIAMMVGLIVTGGFSNDDAFEEKKAKDLEILKDPRLGKNDFGNLSSGLTTQDISQRP